MNVRIMLIAGILAAGAYLVFSGVLGSKSLHARALEIAKASASIVSENMGDEACKPELFAKDADDTVLCFKLSGDLESAKKRVEAAIIKQDDLSRVSWTDDANQLGSAGLVTGLTSDIWLVILLLNDNTSTYGRIIYHSGHGGHPVH